MTQSIRCKKSSVAHMCKSQLCFLEDSIADSEYNHYVFQCSYLEPVGWGDGL